MTRVLFVLLMIIGLTFGCSQKTSNSSKSNDKNNTVNVTPNNSSGGGGNNNGGGGSGNNGGGGTNSCTGCPYGCGSDPGVATAGQTIDYYTIDPDQVILHGLGTGVIAWSSDTDLPSSFNQDIFYTDAKMRIRVIPRKVNSDPQSPNGQVYDNKGRACEFNNPGMAFTKMRIGVTIRRKEDSPGSGYYHLFDNVSVDCPSQPYSFPIPQNSAYPLVIEIKNVEWDYTCTSYLESGYYTQSQLESYGVCPWARVWDKECFKLELQVATDTTKDFDVP
jgi:hypothetical protein